ncbi:MAG: hypothetical protein WC335_06990 [Candidatus Omnitrophota bacterium]
MFLSGKKIPEKEWCFIKKFFLTGIIALFILSPQFFPLIKNRVTASNNSVPSAFSSQRRPFEDLFRQSARPLSYFLPAAVHPVFGKFTEQFVGGGLYGESFTEHTLYLGWIPLLLAGIAYGRWRRLRKTKERDVPAQKTIRYDTQDAFYLGFFIFLGIAAWLFSQPPWWKWGPLKIYMPSFFMYKIIPMYRAYCRFGNVVMFAVAVLAGFGLKVLLERFHSAKVKAGITALVCALVIFEFWNWPPYKMIDVSRVPAVYYWLKDQPGDFAIAEYPLDVKGPTDIYKLYQIVHQKKMINSTTPGTYANDIAKTLIQLSQPRTAGMLRGLGVKYVLVHREDYEKVEISEEAEEMRKVPENPGLKLIKSFSAQSCPDSKIICLEQSVPVEVYEITADPIPVEPLQTKK